MIIVASMLFFLRGTSAAKLLTLIDLENSLKLKLDDRSRKLAGDRLQMSDTEAC
jgi:hypothetical protein